MNCSDIGFPTVTAELVLADDSDRDAWLATRRQGLGGSDASVLAGVNPYSDLHELWLDKMGYDQDTPQTQAMKMGHLLEPVIADLLCEATGLRYQKIGTLRSKTNAIMMVNLDGVLSCGGGAEFKTTSSRTNDAKVWLGGDVPDHAEAQAQWGMAVAGLDHFHAAGLVDGRDFFHVIVPRDDELIDTLTELANDFWVNHVETGLAPEREAPADPYPPARVGSVVDADPDTLHVYENLLDAKNQRKALDDYIADCERLIKNAMADGESLRRDGHEYVTWKATGMLEKARLKADHPELFNRYSTAEPKFDTDSFKAAHPDLYAQYRGRRFTVMNEPKEV